LYRDLLKTEQVCRKWRRIARDTTLWRKMCNYAFIDKVMRVDDAGKETFVKAYPLSFLLFYAVFCSFLLCSSFLDVIEYMTMKRYKQAHHMWLGNCSVITLQVNYSLPLPY
jgi:hypothetical protein